MRPVCLTVALLSFAWGSTTGVMQAAGQDRYPTKPVKIIVPYAPGGATDIVARILGEQLRQILGQSVIVENKPGANGIVAVKEMVSSRPDGYTLMLGNVTTNAITPVLAPAKLPDYDKNVVPVSNIVDIPGILVATTTDFSVKTVPELVDYARSNPGKLRYGTVGAGSYPHYDMAFFAKKAGDLDPASAPLPGKGCLLPAARRRKCSRPCSGSACRRLRHGRSSMPSTSRTSTSCRASRSTTPRPGWPPSSSPGKRSPRR
jgi:tripartite-type tricarboxylate transporter receptor subunit TctC